MQFNNYKSDFEYNFDPSYKDHLLQELSRLLERGYANLYFRDSGKLPTECIKLSRKKVQDFIDRKVFEIKKLEKELNGKKKNV